VTVPLFFIQQKAHDLDL